jgi:hypothetical protein
MANLRTFLYSPSIRTLIASSNTPFIASLRRSISSSISELSDFGGQQQQQPILDDI